MITRALASQAGYDIDETPLAIAEVQETRLPYPGCLVWAE
jgi:hypothetical protein